MATEEQMEQLIEGINSETDIDALRAMAITALISREMTLSSINEAYRGMLSTATPEALVVVERFYKEVQREVAIGNMQLAAEIMRKMFGGQNPLN